MTSKLLQSLLSSIRESFKRSEYFFLIFCAEQTDVQSNFLSHCIYGLEEVIVTSESIIWNSWMFNESENGI